MKSTVRGAQIDRRLHNAVADGEVVQAERRHRQLGRHHRRRCHHFQEDQQVSTIILFFEMNTSAVALLSAGLGKILLKYI